MTSSLSCRVLTYQGTNSTSVSTNPTSSSRCDSDYRVCIIGDVGGQKTLRTYWKNYFEKTDTLIWVVDATDRERINDCRKELMGLLLEEASINTSIAAL